MPTLTHISLRGCHALVMDMDIDSHISLMAAVKVTGIAQPNLARLLAQGRIVGAYKEKGRWHIPQPLTIIGSRRPMKAREGVTILTAPKMPPLPVGTFRCHVIDPPWPIEKIARQVRPAQVEMDYPVMTLADIEHLPVPRMTEMSGAHLYLWTTQKYLPQALALVAKWGYRYQCLLTWVKNGGMTPYSWQYNTEHVIFATIGDLALNRLGLKLAFEGERREHSRKPEAFYELVLKASPGPRMEWFGRQSREGFVGWGNEVGRYDPL